MSAPKEPAERAEWIATMLLLAARDPEADELLRARAWEMVATSHEPEPSEAS